MVDRLDDRLHAHLGAFLRRPGEVRAIDRGHRVMRDAVGDQPGHHMQARAFQDGGVVQRLGDGIAEVGLAAGQGGHAAFALRPVPRRGVEQHLRQPVVLQPRGDLGRREVVGEQELDPLEAGLGGQGEAVEERHLVEHHREVRGEARHSGISPKGSRGRLTPPGRAGQPQARRACAVGAGWRHANGYPAHGAHHRDGGADRARRGLPARAAPVHLGAAVGGDPRLRDLAGVHLHLPAGQAVAQRSAPW